MKKFLIILSIACFFVFIGCKSRNIKKTSQTFKFFKIEIEQNNELKTIENKEVAIKKESFTLVIYFLKPDNLLINASFDSETFRFILNGEKTTFASEFQNKPIVEEPFNKDESLIVSDKSSNYWYYRNESEHTFSTVLQKENSFVCKRKIAFVKKSQTDKEKTLVSKIKKNDLYLVFMKLEWNKDYSKRIELKRDYLHIKFIENTQE